MESGVHITDLGRIEYSGSDYGVFFDFCDGKDYVFVSAHPSLEDAKNALEQIEDSYDWDATQI